MTESNYTYDPTLNRQFFNEHGMREFERYKRAPADQVNLYMHTRCLMRFIQPGMKILEIGAGPGIYTKTMAELGTQLVIADLSPVQLELNRKLALDHGYSESIQSWVEVDICNLEPFETETFDAVVVFGGPFSYVLDRRNDALAESIRVLRQDGLLLLSVMSLWGTVHRFLTGVLERPMDLNMDVLNSGDLSPQIFPDRTNFMHLFRATELREWLQSADLEILMLSAANCLSLRWDRELESICDDPEQWSHLLELETQACADENYLNAGTHLIAVTRKPRH